MTFNGPNELEETKKKLRSLAIFYFRRQPAELTENEYFRLECQRLYQDCYDKIQDDFSYIMGALAGAIGLFHFGEFSYVYKILDYYAELKNKLDDLRKNEPHNRTWKKILGGLMTETRYALRILPLPESMREKQLPNYCRPDSVEAVRQWLDEYEDQLEYDEENFCYRLKT